jgi:hypothetical protein
MIALISKTEGVCLDGRYRGWLMRRHPDGEIAPLFVEPPPNCILPPGWRAE